MLSDAEERELDFIRRSNAVYLAEIVKVITYSAKSLQHKTIGRTAPLFRHSHSGPDEVKRTPPDLDGFLRSPMGGKHHQLV
jgi:hypothetical protein